MAEIGEPTRTEPWDVPVPRKVEEPRKTPPLPAPKKDPVPA